jgi:predicted ArsR family transcriptional regulator
VLEELSWAYGKTHRIANELVRRGVLHRAGAPQDVGRPRVIYSLTAALGSGRTASG